MVCLPTCVRHTVLKLAPPLHVHTFTYKRLPAEFSVSTAVIALSFYWAGWGLEYPGFDPGQMK